MTALRRPASIEPPSRDGRLIAGLAAVVALPFVVSTIRALRDGWLAIGDNGNFLIRSRDVFTSHHPLLGTWSSASIPIGENVNHPGPLLFDLLAIPAKLGGSGGLAVGVLLVHLAAIGLMAWFGQRAGGTRLAFASLAACAGLAWSMGSELLYDPWQPHTLLFPVLLLVVLVVGMVRGDLLAMPVAVGVASLIVQTHLSYTLLVPPLVALGVAWLVRRHGRDVLVALGVSAVVAAVCWAQPLADQIAGEGNLGTLVSGVGVDQETVGPALGIRITAEVLATPPWWGRPGFGDALRVPPGQAPLVGDRPNVSGLPSLAVAVVGLLLVGVVLAGAGLRARRSVTPETRSVVGVAAFAALVAAAVTVRLPVGGVGVPPHQVRYLWPIGAFATVAAALALLPARWAVRALGVAAAGLAILTLPSQAVPAGPQADRAAIPIVRELSGQLGSLAGVGTVVYDTSRLRFAEPWTSALLAVMQERGIDFTVDDPVWARQLGGDRADRGEAAARVFALEGDAASTVPDGTRRVAYVPGLDVEEVRELHALERRLVDLPVELSDSGRAARSNGALLSFADGTPTAEQLLAFGELAALVNDGLLEIPDDRAAEVARYAALRYRWDRLTVGLFLDPDPYGAGEGGG